MDCKRVTELLPLYVGSDLGERDLKLVTEHVRSCENCTSSMDEYRQTRWMVQGFAPPAFGDDLYTGIREHVLNEIGNKPARATLSHLFASLFSSPVRWAAFAVLVVTVALSFYIIGVRVDTDQRTALTSPADSPMQDPIEPSRDDKSLQSSNGDNTKPGIVTGGSDVHRSQRKTRFEKAAERPRKRIAAQVPEIINAKTAPENDRLPNRDPAASPAAVRMEIQTSDPNIRIIWFSPRPGGSASNNISKDS